MPHFRRLLTLVMAVIAMFVLSFGYASSQPPAFDELVRIYSTNGQLAVAVTKINLTTNSIVYDPVSDRIYASVPSSIGIGGNSIVSISVPTGTVSTPIFVGSEPNKLAVSDDGKFLYVGLDGASAVRRVNLISQTAELQFPLGSTFCGNLRAEDMVVLKGNPNTVAISRRNSGCSPRHEGVAIFDDGIQRPTTTPGHTGSNVIEPSSSESILYGYNNETTEFGFRVMSVLSTGVVVTSSTAGLISGFGVDIRSEDGFVYATTGAMVNPATLSLVGTYSAYGPVCPDSSVGRVYFLNGPQLQIFDQATFVPIMTIPIAGVAGDSTDLIKVGQDRLAFRTNAGQVFLLRFVELDKFVYLPLIALPRPGISGQVMENGIPASNVPLDLRFFNGSSWYTIASAFTESDGSFSFTGIPSLGPGQYYYVRYQNTTGAGAMPNRLWTWHTRSLSSYTAGSSVFVGGFDVANIALVSPPNGASVSLPHTFQWTPRAAALSDSYEFDLFEPNTGDPYYFTDPLLGYVGSYTLNALPPGFSVGNLYGWEIWIASPDGGYGFSYETRAVYFNNSGQFGKAQSGVFTSGRARAMDMLDIQPRGVRGGQN